MSDFEDTYEEDDDQQSSQNPVRARMKQLEKENRQKDALLAEAAEAKKELAFLKAGIDTSDPKFKYFVKGYDGELVPDAIKMAASEAQLITPQPSIQDQDKAAWQQSNKIAAGAETGSEGPSWIKRIRDASSTDEIEAIFAEAQAQGVDLGNN